MLELKMEITVTKIDLTAIWPALKSQARVCAEEVKAEEEKVIANWLHKPVFTIAESGDEFRVTYEIVPTGETLQWRVVSRGAEGKTIVPKAAPALRFPYQGKGVSYIPKTKPGLVYGGPGTKVGPIHRFNKVDWPGIQARRFEETVMARYSQTFHQKMLAALTSAKVR
jgi:hypothetical protein